MCLALVVEVGAATRLGQATAHQVADGQDADEEPSTRGVEAVDEPGRSQDTHDGENVGDELGVPVAGLVSLTTRRGGRSKSGGCGSTCVSPC